MNNKEKLDNIYWLMRKNILIKKEKDKNNKDFYYPIKNTSKQDCFMVLYEIQKLLRTNGFPDNSSFVEKFFDVIKNVFRK